VIKWVADNFIPIHGERPTPVWYAWAGGSLVLIWLFTAWALGFLPTDAFGDGFARATQVKQIHLTLLENELVETRIRHCNSAKPQPRQFFYEQLQKKQRIYYELTGQRYELPACKDLGQAEP